MSTKQIVETNIVTFLSEVQAAIKEGYYVDNTIAGYPSNGTLKEVLLFKEPKLAPKKSNHLVKRIDVSEYDAALFLLAFQEAVLEGYLLDEEAVRWDSLKIVGMQKAPEPVIVNRGNVNGGSVVEIMPPEVKVYSRKALKDMDYQELKLLAQQIGTFHRSKDIMAKNTYTKLQEMFVKPSVEEVSVQETQDVQGE